jgi:hypothetical protein
MSGRCGGGCCAFCRRCGSGDGAAAAGFGAASNDSSRCSIKSSRLDILCISSGVTGATFAAGAGAGDGLFCALRLSSSGLIQNLLSGEPAPMPSGFTSSGGGAGGNPESVCAIAGTPTHSASTNPIAISRFIDALRLNGTTLLCSSGASASRFRYSASANKRVTASCNNSGLAVAAASNFSSMKRTCSARAALMMNVFMASFLVVVARHYKRRYADTTANPKEWSLQS